MSLYIKLLYCLRRESDIMKSIVLDKVRLWYVVLFVGVCLVFAGLYQIVATFSASSSKVVKEMPGISIVQPKSKSVETKENSTSENENKPNEFFVEHRLERDRIRSQQIDWLREVVNNANSPEETRREAQRRILGITQAIDTEMKIESLIKAENFKDAVVLIQDKSATIIVQAPMLTNLDKKTLTGIAVRITGLSAENIVIITRR
jgi:stage III sporulation protein AH